jgi:hypothetical protein
VIPARGAIRRHFARRPFPEGPMPRLVVAVVLLVVLALALGLPLAAFAAEDAADASWFRWGVDGAAWVATTYGPLIGALVTVLAMVGRWLDRRIETFGARLEKCVHESVQKLPPVKMTIVAEDGSPARVHVVPAAGEGPRLVKAGPG